MPNKRNPNSYRRSPETYKKCVKARIESNNRRFPERFWKRVDKSNAKGCWPWIGQIVSTTGYGTVYRGRPIGVHRIAWELTHGVIEGGLYVLHKCDNRACCNPDHLFLGTHLDNMKDMAAKGRAGSPCRGKFGAQGFNAKLTETQAKEIIKRYKAGGITLVKLAKEYGVDDTTCSKLWRGTTWPNLDR